MKMSRRKYRRLFELAAEVNGFEEREREATGCLPTVFAEFSGHIAMVSVRVCSNGWSPSEYPDFSWDIYMGDRFDPKLYNECISKLTQLKSAQVQEHFAGASQKSHLDGSTN